MSAETMNGPTNDEKRAHVHMMWAGVADQWAAHADEVDERSAGVTERMLAAAALSGGERVLELACGPGGAGLAAASLVGPEGIVVLSDAVDAMAQIAADRATSRGLQNVRAATLDLEQIDEPDESFDVVLIREGLMFAVDPIRAVDEIHRVLRPHGRLAIAVWGPQRDNPWLGLVFEAVTAVVGIPVPPPGLPGPFALSDASSLARLLRHGGFADVSIERIDTSLTSPSFEAWWARTTAVAGPIAALLARLDAATMTALEQRLRGDVERYSIVDGLNLPGLALVASARRG